MNPDTKDKDLTLIQLFDRFADEDSARHHLESVIWKNGIVCPHCKCSEQAKFGLIKPNKSAKTRAGLRWCSNCKSKFTVTIGTIFEDSHIPLRKWLIAWYLLCSSKKGISSLQLQRLLEFGSYRSALFMAHRIRYALAQSSYADKLEGTIEADEAFIGGVTSGKGRGGSGSGKVPIMATVQRGGPVRSKVMPTVNGANLKQASGQCEDQFRTAYRRQFCFRGLEHEYYHKSVKHAAGEYSRHEGENIVTTASVDRSFPC